MSKKLNITKDWYTRRQRQKEFNVRVIRESNGTYRVAGVDVLNKVNQHETRPQKVDARDFSGDFFSNEIYCK